MGSFQWQGGESRVPDGPLVSMAPGTRVEQGPQRAGGKRGLAGRARRPSTSDLPALRAAETGAGGDR